MIYHVIKLHWGREGAAKRATIFLIKEKPINLYLNCQTFSLLNVFRCLSKCTCGAWWACGQFSPSSTFSKDWTWLSGLCDKHSGTEPSCQPKNGKKKKLNTLKHHTESEAGCRRASLSPQHLGGRSSRNPCEFEAHLHYKVSSKTARATWLRTCLRKINKGKKRRSENWKTM